MDLLALESHESSLFSCFSMFFLIFLVRLRLGMTELISRLIDFRPFPAVICLQTGGTLGL